MTIPTPQEKMREGLRKALRIPEGINLHALDGDSRSSLDRAVDYVTAEFRATLMEIVGEVEKKIKNKCYGYTTSLPDILSLLTKYTEGLESNKE